MGREESWEKGTRRNLRRKGTQKSKNGEIREGTKERMKGGKKWKGI